MANIEALFEMATRKKFRFNFKGMISTEDLWDVNFAGLDTIYQGLMKEKKDESEESLMVSNKKSDELDAKIEIVKHVYETKVDEKNKRQDAEARRKQKQEIARILEKKKDEQLMSMTPEQLTEMLNKMNAEDEE